MPYDEIYERTKEAFKNLSCDELKSIEQEILKEIESIKNIKEKREFISTLNAIYFILDIKCND